MNLAGVSCRLGGLGASGALWCLMLCFLGVLASRISAVIVEAFESLICTELVLEQEVGGTVVMAWAVLGPTIKVPARDKTADCSLDASGQIPYIF